MPMISSKVYDAFISAGVSKEEAQEAAEETADYQKDIKSIKSEIIIVRWMFTIIMALLLPMFWQIFSLYKSLLD